MLLMIDNYDSFTYNLVHYCAELGAEVTVRRNDSVDLDAVTALAPSSIIVSPGPCTPDQAGISMPLIKHFAGRVPILGVCLGHQSIGQVFGGRVVHARSIMHGKTSRVYHDGSTPFYALPSPFTATRYHSLVIERDSLPGCLTVTAWTGADEDDEIMAIAHRELPVWGVQFHPESILSEHGHALLRNFLDAAAAFNESVTCQ